MRVVVTSAWSAEVAVVDASNAAALTVVARLATGREPRGVAITPDGKTAFVSHLVGSALTRIDDLEGAPRATSAPLRAAPERGPSGHEAAASLGYALVLSPDGSTLFAPRHALGAEGTAAWWGAPTVDVMDVSTGASLKPTRESDEPSSSLDYAAVDARPPDAFGAFAGLAPRADSDLVQPRAIVYRKRTHSLFVASEGASRSWSSTPTPRAQRWRGSPSSTFTTRVLSSCR